MRIKNLLVQVSSTYFHTLSSVPPSQTPTLSHYRTKTFSHLFQECSSQRALKPAQQSHALMITSGFHPTIFVTNCLLHLYIKCSSFVDATKVFDKMPQRDKVSFNAMLSGFFSTGDVDMAARIFGAMPERDVISWNTMISGYLESGDIEESVRLFVTMGREGVAYDRTTFAVVLRVCGGLEDEALGMQVHGVVVKTGFELDVVTASAIVGMYGKCRRLDYSLAFFDEMAEKNWVSWSALIASCVHNGELVTGLELFKEMQSQGVGVNQALYASCFRSCAALSESIFGSQLHCHALKTNFGCDVIVGTATLDMYAKCGNLSDAEKLFNVFPKRNVQSHNALIVGYARADRGFDALRIFRMLVNSGIGFDAISLSGAFSACAVIKGHFQGIQLHSLAIKSLLASDVCVANAILDMYGKCRALEEARAVFDAMKMRDAVSWNAIIAAYEQNGVEEETLLLYTEMLQFRLEPDEFTYGSVLKACAGQQDIESGVRIHNRIIKSGMGLETFVGIALVDMYCKCDKMDEAEKLHERIGKETMVSWNAIISGFSSCEQSEEAQKVFLRMLKKGIPPDNFTYATVLDTCANLATVELGKQIHAQIIKQELQSDTYIASTLVDMYSKCGMLQASSLVFERSRNRDFVTWNAMVCGYAQHGLAEEALKVFEKMKHDNVKVNHATFVAVLRACAHMGLIQEGICYFESMQSDYGLDPTVEHYSCMVDLLGRCGRVSDALKLIQDMPFEADDVIWRTLLSICKMQGNVEVAEIAATRLLQLDPQDSSSYILLSNIYANAGMWNEVSNMRKILRHCKLKKEPGCSWIELLSEVHMFLVGDKAHLNCKEIYENLDFLTADMRNGCCSPAVEFLLDEVMEDTREASARGGDSKLDVNSKPEKAKKAKAVKDPNKPKRPPGAFFVFMEDFRQEYKAKHPNNKSVSAVGKAGGERWKSLSDFEKAPFIAKAVKRKAEYEKSIQAYNRKEVGEVEAEDEESDKSESEVHDDDETRRVATRGWR